MGATDFLTADLPRVLGPDEERALLEDLDDCRRRMAEGPEARRRYLVLRERLALANVRLVRLIARRFRTCPVDREDLEQAGLCGLLAAIDRQDAGRALRCRFAAYAKWWVLSAMQAEVREVGYAVRMTRHGIDAGRAPDGRRSLDAPLGPGDGRTLGQLVEDGDDGWRARAEAALDAEAILGTTLGPAEAREREVLRLYFLEGLTLKQAGRRVGVSGQHAGQLVAETLGAVRERLAPAGSGRVSA